MKPLPSLILAAFLIALIWRLEIEWRGNGWASLEWIRYFHIAIPLGGMLFVVWVWWQARHTPRRQRILAIVACWGIIATPVLSIAAKLYFAAGPSAMALLPLPIVAQLLSPLAWGGAILLLYACLRTVFAFPKHTWPIGFALWMGSWHLGQVVISVIDDRGTPSLIHALKTGWMIPFCVIAVGLPFLSLQRSPARGEQIA